MRDFHSEIRHSKLTFEVIQLFLQTKNAYLRKKSK